MALTVLVSTLARRVRQAVLLAYPLIFTWLFAPSFVALIGSRLYGLAYQWIQPVNVWLEQSEPVWSLCQASIARAGRFDVFIGDGGLFLDGRPSARRRALLLLLPPGRLRPAFRRQEETPARRTWFVNRRPASPPRALRPARVRRRRGALEGTLLRADRCFYQDGASAGDRRDHAPLALITEVHGDLRQVSSFLAVWAGARRLIREGLVWALGSTSAGTPPSGCWPSPAHSVQHRDRARGRHLGQPYGHSADWLADPARQGVRGVWNQRGFAAVLVFHLAAGLGDRGGSTARDPCLDGPGRHADLAGRGGGDSRVVTGHHHFAGPGPSDRGPLSLQRISVHRRLLVYRVTLMGFVFTCWASCPGSRCLRWCHPSSRGSGGGARGARRRRFALREPESFVPAGRFVLVAIFVAAAAILTWRVVGGFDDVLARPRLRASPPRR